MNFAFEREHEYLQITNICILLQYSVVYTLSGPEIPKGYLANSEDPDEIPHNAAFQLSLHCLLRQNQFSDPRL